MPKKNYLHMRFFSAMSPWETVKSPPLSFLVTDGVSDPEEHFEIVIFDICRATDRELYIELPDEAKAQGDDASNNFLRK